MQEMWSSRTNRATAGNPTRAHIETKVLTAVNRYGSAGCPEFVLYRDLPDFSPTFLGCVINDLVRQGRLEETGPPFDVVRDPVNVPAERLDFHKRMRPHLMAACASVLRMDYLDVEADEGSRKHGLVIRCGDLSIKARVRSHADLVRARDRGEFTIRLQTAGGLPSEWDRLFKTRAYDFLLYSVANTDQNSLDYWVMVDVDRLGFEISQSQERGRLVGRTITNDDGSRFRVLRLGDFSSLVVRARWSRVNAPRHTALQRMEKLF